MAYRPESIKGIAYGCGIDAGTVENVTKVLAKVDGRNSTSVGRGIRDEDWSVEKLVSTLLGVGINDLKNCPRKVASISQIKTKQTSFVVHTHGVKSFASFKGSQEYFNEVLSELDLFEHICNFVVTVAADWDGETHQSFRRGFQLVINTGDIPGAVLSHFVQPHKAPNTEWWIKKIFSLESQEADIVTLPYSSLIQRQAVLTIEHIETLAILYADSLRSTKAEGFEAIKAPSIDAFFGPKDELRPQVKNENASSPRKELAGIRNQDRDTIQATCNLDNGREREKTQALSVCGSGDSLDSKRSTTHVRSSSYNRSHIQPAAA